MYTKRQQIISTKESLANFFEGYDVYNAVLPGLLGNPTTSRESYEITVYQYRPDLIAKDFYGSESYMGVLMLQTGLSLEGYKKGTVLKLIPKTELDELLRQCR